MSLPFFGGRRGNFVPESYVGRTLATFANGTFSRSSNGTYLTSATTVAEATSNVLRLEDRGDGAGSLALLEGARTNLCGYSDQLASWVTIANNLGYSAAGTSPLGTNTAGRILKNLGSNTAPAYAINIGGTKAGTLSFWAKDNGSSQPTCRVRFSFSTGITLTYTPTGTWARYDTYRAFTGVANDFISFDTRANVPDSGDPALGATIDHLIWGVQLEAVVTFPSSTIINNSAASATRSADTLTLSTSQYNAALRSVPWSCTVSPRFANTDLISTEEHWLYSFGSANSGIRFRRSAGVVKLEVVSGGSVVVASDALTFSRQALITLTVRPAAGQITVSGATAGNGTNTGTAWTFANDTLRVGGILSGGSELFGRLSQPVGAV